MTDPRIVTYRGHTPALAADVFIADTARVIGQVTLGAGASVWYGAVLRGDVHTITVGARVNIQDGSIVHVTSGRHATVIEDDVTVGHRAVIHGCHVGACALIGMGAVILDGAVIGAGSVIGAGAVVAPKTVIPEGVLALGAPAKVVRPLRPDERAGLLLSAAHYAELAGTYRGMP